MADQTHADKFSALEYDLFYNKLVANSTEIRIYSAKRNNNMKYHSNLCYKVWILLWIKIHKTMLGSGTERQNSLVWISNRGNKLRKTQKIWKQLSIDLSLMQKKKKIHYWQFLLGIICLGSTKCLRNSLPGSKQASIISLGFCCWRNSIFIGTFLSEKEQFLLDSEGKYLGHSWETCCLGKASELFKASLVGKKKLISWRLSQFNKYLVLISTIVVFHAIQKWKKI